MIGKKRKEEKFERQNRSEKENYVYVCAGGGFKRISPDEERNGLRDSLHFVSQDNSHPPTTTICYDEGEKYLLKTTSQAGQMRKQGSKGQKGEVH